MEELKVTGGDFVTEKKGKLRDNYRIGNKLGDGAFGSVRKITHQGLRRAPSSEDHSQKEPSK
jgi:hypothetical protein